MSNAHGVLGFMAGALVGAAAGLVAGVLMAPRAGAETRDMVVEGAGEAWDNLVDTCQRGVQETVEKVGVTAADVTAKSDELREKVDQARARMDQIRSNLAATAASVEAQSQPAAPAETPAE